MAVSQQSGRRRSIRLPAYDYRSAGAYFITICTSGRENIFADQRWRLVAEQVWRHVIARSRDRRGDAFVVMPNHVHGIVWIVGTRGVGARHTGEPEPHHSGDWRFDAEAGVRHGRASPLHGSLGAIVGSFKSAVARRINEARSMPGAPSGSATITSE